MKEARRQIAALPLRWKDGEVEVLMVTSRETKRWIVPKGWTMKDRKPWEAAATEALEEAGVTGRIADEVFGTYSYLKKMDDGRNVLCRVRVYPMTVAEERSKWKEKAERRRAWFSARRAAKLVDEPELAALLRSLSKKPKKLPVAGPLLRRAAEAA